MSKSELVSRLLNGIDYIKIMALAINPFACGFVSYPNSKGTVIKKDYHDHDNEPPYVQDENYRSVPYDSNKHGEVINFIPEGGEVPGYPTEKGYKLIHRHPRQGYPTASYGPYETRYEKEQDPT